MRRFNFWILTILAISLGLFFGVYRVEAEVNCDGKSGDDLYSCLGLQIDELNKAMEQSRAATKPLEDQVAGLQAKIKSIQRQIDLAVVKTEQLEKDVQERSGKVAVSYTVLASKTREYYKKMRSTPLWVSLLLYDSLGEMRREMSYRQESNDKDKQIIVNLVQEIGGLEADKKKVEENKVALTKLQTDLDKQNNFLGGEIAKAKDYQKDLSGKIVELTALQAKIKAEKEGTFQTTVGDVPLADDLASRPDYNPGFSPAFAAFSFGAPHFKGLSQYGAYGRAKSGQSAEDILHAYYGGIEIKKDYDNGRQIRVCDVWHTNNGEKICDVFYSSVDIETYVKRIYEVPNSWGDNGGFEALKAQAVAARSYALAYTDNGNGWICDSQDCQVYKDANKGGKWEEAVNATRGWVLWNNNKPFKAWFASTSGGYQESYTDTYSGYTTSSFWDTPSGKSGWTSQAYEKVAGSPWFYKAWYKGASGDSCGRSHPWLTGEEVADVLNAWVYYYKHGNDERLLPVGGCVGGNPYSVSELKNLSGSFGGGYSVVSGVSVTYSDGGYTASVHFETDKGGVDVNGLQFKEAFNKRAPGWVSLKSGLFNIEKK